MVPKSSGYTKVKVIRRVQCRVGRGTNYQSRVEEEKWMRSVYTEIKINLVKKKKFSFELEGRLSFELENL